MSQRPLRVPYAMRNAGSTAGEADVLTGETGAQHVDWIDLTPVDLVDIAEVGYIRVPGSQQRADVAVVVGDPYELGPEGPLNGHVQAAVARTERTETKLL